MSPEWQWVFGVVGGVAFLMATPSFLQVLFGGPRLCISLDESEEYEGKKVLQCRLVNSPNMNALLRILGVRREAAQEVVIAVEIRRRHNRELIGTPYVAGINVSEDSYAVNTMIPASLVARKAPLIYWDAEAQETFTCSGLTRRERLTDGEYLAAIEIHYGSRSIRLQHLFFVHKDLGNVRWM